MYTVSEIPVRRARLCVPGLGYWSVAAELESGARVTAGQAVQVTAGGLALSGTAELVIEFGGVVHVSVVPGAGRWQTALGERGFRSGSGIKLLQVLTAITETIGEQVSVEATANRSLGYAWEIAAGSAADAIQAATRGAHWTDETGLLRVGARPTGVGPRKLAVSSYAPVLRRARISLPEDDWPLALPGRSLSGEGLPEGFVVAALEIRVDGPDVEAEVYQA